MGGMPLDADSLIGAEKGGSKNLVGEAETKTTLRSHQIATAALFTAVTNESDYLTTLHAATPPRSALLFF